MRLALAAVSGILFVLGPAAALTAEEPPADLDLQLELLLDKQRFTEFGLHKLSATELAKLNDFITELVAKHTTPSEPEKVDFSDRRSYLIESTADDELFVINGRRYKARTYCFNVNEGDRVVFVEGSPFGDCGTAVFVNLRTGESCEVWCE
jgi:hypothetical protein